MSDRELLERAAKAAGIDLSDCEFRFGYFRREETHGQLGFRFAPLTDDGDALRLAIDREVRFGVILEDSRGWAEIGDDYYAAFEWNPHRPSDRYEATRRAIVTAVANVERDAHEQAGKDGSNG